MYVQLNLRNNTSTFIKLIQRKPSESQRKSKQLLFSGFKIAIVGLSLILGGCITVDSTADSVDINPGDGICKDSANRCTLRAAIMEAEAASVLKYTIIVPAGHYKLTLPPESGGGSLKITKSIRIRGDGSNSTIIEQTQQDLVIHIQKGADVEIDHVAVQGGHINRGGGIRVDRGNVELENLNIRDNFGFTGGGGLYVLESAVVRMYRSTVDSNFAQGAFGGGIWNQGQLWVYDSTISNNESNRTGGIHNNGQMNLRNVTVSGNSGRSSQASTGGINQAGFAVLNNVTVTNNTSSGYTKGSWEGGGIHTWPDDITVMKNSIVAGNFGNGGPNDCVGELTSDSTHNLIGDTTDCIIKGSTTTYILDVPADLGPLANNGGPTQTHEPLFYSPARDAGYGFPPPAYDACEARDQRGVPRPQGSGGCDMGAYEHTLSNRFVTGIMLVNASTNSDITLVRNGDVLILDELPSELSLRAVVSGADNESVEFGPGSVEFGYDTDPSFRIENVAPYSLFGDSSGDYAAATFTPGDHTVTATPFLYEDASGQAGGALTINFTVIDE